MRKFYAGIGSRRAPATILKLMRDIGYKLFSKTYVLRTGDAAGSDAAFAARVGDPWKKVYKSSHVGQRALSTIEWFHPAPHKLKPLGRLLIARDLYQITGKEFVNDFGDVIGSQKHDLLTMDRSYLSQFVVCWTRDGAHTAEMTSIETGGTGQAIRIADYLSVPVWNLQNDSHKVHICELLDLDFDKYRY